MFITPHRSLFERHDKAGHLTSVLGKRADFIQILSINSAKNAEDSTVFCTADWTALSMPASSTRTCKYRSHRPALADTEAGRFLTDGVEPMLTHDAAGLGEGARPRRLYPDPGGLGELPHVRPPRLFRMARAHTIQNDDHKDLAESPRRRLLSGTVARPFCEGSIGQISFTALYE